MQSQLKTLCLLVSLLCLTGCGAANLVYNSAPTLVAAEFDDAFDLSETQSDQLDAALQDFFDWHREYELPRYQQMLESASLAVSDGITAKELNAIYADVEAAARRAGARLIDDIGELAATLTPEQIDHYETYHEENGERFRDYLAMSPQQREIFRTQRSLKRMQNWFGRMDEWQQERIARQLQPLPDGRSTWIAFREDRHRVLVEAMRSADEDGLTPAQLKYILVDPTSKHAQAYEPERIAYFRAYADFIEELSPQLSKAQLRHAAERLEYFAEIIEDIRQSG